MQAIISIRPEFAEAIVAGSKTIELRRRIPPIPIGTRLWIYATRPVAAVIGSAVVNKIIRGTPADIWNSLGDCAGIQKAEYNAYFRGTGEAIGLSLTEVQPYQPISIETLRAELAGFHPPQVILRLTDKAAISLSSLAKIC